MKKLIITLAVAAVSASAFAQRSFDVFNVPKTIVAVNGQNFIAGSLSVTNGPYDVRMFDGLASVDVFTYTNTGATGATMTLTIQGSSSTTAGTQSNVGNLAFINTLTSINYTNSASTNQVATDSFLIPGSYTSYTPSSNLAAGIVLNPPNYTNSGAITLPLGYSKIGWSIGDGPRYVWFILTPGGTVTNITAAASLTGINEGPLK